MNIDKIKERINEIFDISAEPAVDIISSMFIEGAIGSIVPGVTSVMLAYKQKRQEKMFVKFMEEMQTRQDEFEDKVLRLDEESAKKIRTDFFGIVSDVVLDEVQEEKIKYIVNGFINLASIPNAKEDFVLIYYDTLNSLRVVDLGLLIIYNDPITNMKEGFQKAIDKIGVKNDQVEMINRKLLSLGLLASSTEDDVLTIYKHLKDPEDRRHLASNPFDDISSRARDMPQLTKFGRDFMEFFVDNY